MIRPYRLTVRTSRSQCGNRSSILRGVTMKDSDKEKMEILELEIQESFKKSRELNATTVDILNKDVYQDIKSTIIKYLETFMPKANPSVRQ